MLLAKSCGLLSRFRTHSQHCRKRQDHFRAAIEGDTAEHGAGIEDGAAVSGEKAKKDSDDTCQDCWCLLRPQG